VSKFVLLGLVVVAVLFVGGCSLLQQQGPPLQNWQPVLSPDGTTLAYASPGSKGFELFTRNLATGDVKQLTQNEVDDWEPNWSPQGDRLVYVSNQNKNVDLYIIDLKTMAISRLTSQEKEDVNPTWGANGKIYFNSNRSGSWEMYSIDPDGKNLTQVTQPPSTSTSQ
jgi:TolB protein